MIEQRANTSLFYHSIRSSRKCFFRSVERITSFTLYYRITIHSDLSPPLHCNVISEIWQWKSLEMHLFRERILSTKGIDNNRTSEGMCYLVLHVLPRYHTRLITIYSSFIRRVKQMRWSRQECTFAYTNIILSLADPRTFGKMTLWSFRSDEGG